MDYLFEKHLSKVVVMTLCELYRKFPVLLMLAIIFTWATASIAFAIDNPDAPNYMGQFMTREKQYLEKINDPTNTTKAYSIAYDQYLTFLDQELNAGYQLLMAKLPEAQKEAFKKSQKKWIQFRDAEFEFINGNWTQEHFGSSANLSRGTYHSEIVRNRVLQMLHYVKNY